MCQKLVLALFRCRQQFAELRSSSELHKQRVGLQGDVRTIVLFNGAFQQANSGIFLTTIRQQSAYEIPRLRVTLSKCGGFDLPSGSVALG